MNGSTPVLGELRHAVARHWWILLLRGLAAVAFGILAFVWPGLTLTALIFLFGFHCVVDGIVSLMVGSAARRLWPTMLIAVISILAGLVSFFYPGVTAFVLLYLIAAWAIVRGIFEILYAMEVRKVIEGELLLILAGLASVAFGVLILLYPGAGALSVIWIVGSYALVFGVLLVVLSFRIKSIA
jgi:uncharacterized membrane protein HdeD (DUF308 family)